MLRYCWSRRARRGGVGGAAGVPAQQHQSAASQRRKQAAAAARKARPCREGGIREERKEIIFLYIRGFLLKNSFVRNLDNMARTHDLLLMLIDRAWHSVPSAHLTRASSDALSHLI